MPAHSWPQHSPQPGTDLLPLHAQAQAWQRGRGPHGTASCLRPYDRDRSFDSHVAGSGSHGGAVGQQALGSGLERAHAHTCYVKACSVGME